MISFQSSKIKITDKMKFILDKAINKIDLDFEYPDPSGSLNLRNLIKNYHPHWKGECLITNSATEATFLALSLLKGKRLALNVPSYFGVIRQAKYYDIEIIEWNNVDELLKLKNIDGILLTSNFTPPTGKSFSAKDKERIAKYANDNSALVIEDNAYEFLNYSDIPLLCINAEKSIKINSFSKVLSPSLRVGFLITDKSNYNILRSNKITINLSSPSLQQNIIENIISDNNFIKNWQNELKTRANLLKELFYENFNINIDVNDGGSFVKLDLGNNINVKEFIINIKNRNILLDDNKNQYIDKNSKNYIRLNVGSVTTEEIKKSISIFKEVFIDYNII